MQKTIFLSGTTSEFAEFRARLGHVIARSPHSHVRHQDDFAQRGVVTLDALYEEIQQSDVVLQAVGGNTGAFPSINHVEMFLQAHPSFDVQFPDVVQLAREGKVSYTHWEAWLALYLKKRLCCYHVISRLPNVEDQETDGEPRQQHDFLKMLQSEPYTRFAMQVENEDSLYDEVIATLIALELLTSPKTRARFVVMILMAAVAVGGVLWWLLREPDLPAESNQASVLFTDGTAVKTDFQRLAAAQTHDVIRVLWNCETAGFNWLGDLLEEQPNDALRVVKVLISNQIRPEELVACLSQSERQQIAAATPETILGIFSETTCVSAEVFAVALKDRPDLVTLVMQEMIQ